MFTADDVTVSNAPELYAQIRHTAVDLVGFKDLGLPHAGMREIVESAHADGREVALEVVTEGLDAELASARAAAELGVDYLIGGTHAMAVAPTIAGTAISFYPYVGEVVGHPCHLRGEIDAITAAATEALGSGAHGINLLAYRYLDGDPLKLVEAVMEVAEGRVIVAGDVRTRKQISELERAGVEAFTIGGAVMNRTFAGSSSIGREVEEVLKSMTVSHE